LQKKIFSEIQNILPFPEVLEALKSAREGFIQKCTFISLKDMKILMAMISYFEMCSHYRPK